MKLKRMDSGAANKRRMNLEIKEVTEAGTFEGLLSPYGNVDDGGDVVERGAYTKTLQEHGNKVPLLWQHKSDSPVGELALEDRQDGLWCKGTLLMELPEARKAYLLMKAGIVKGLSIGFNSVKDAVEGGVRHLKEIRLYEGSIVTFPMNEQALISSVKARETKGDFAEELTERQILDGWYQMADALRAALCSVLYATATKDEKITMAEAVIEQFRESFMAFLPGYLDCVAEVCGMKSAAPREEKAGRKISAANKTTIRKACEHMKSANDILAALIAEEAEEEESEDTSKAGAAAEQKSEPANHSAILNAINELKGLL